jgi:hypothetical protein
MYNGVVVAADDGTRDLRYPIGPFSEVVPVSPAVRRAAVDDLAALPSRIRTAVDGLADWQLDTPYRPGGWTPRQVVHHLADSHLNALIRMKLALTEETPTVKPYDEKAWAELADSRLPVDLSLAILDGLHARWVALCPPFDSPLYARAFVHPEHGRALSLDWLVQQYAWHSRHHAAHVTGLRVRQGW